jgi:hypothetical protein
MDLFRNKQQCNTSFYFPPIIFHPAHAVVEQPLVLCCVVLGWVALYCVVTQITQVFLPCPDQAPNQSTDHKANERMVKLNNTVLVTALAFLQGIEAINAFASTLQRVKNSLTNQEYTREELKIGIAGFYDRSSKLWEDVWGEVSV